MKIEVSTEEIEQHAARIAKERLRGQVNDLVKGEIDALQNFSKLRQDVWSLQGEVRRLNDKITKIETKRWWKHAKD